MAKVDAAALTIALRDDTLDEVALDFRNSKHPLRAVVNNVA